MPPKGFAVTRTPDAVGSPEKEPFDAVPRFLPLLLLLTEIFPFTTKQSSGAWPGRLPRFSLPFAHNKPRALLWRFHCWDAPSAPGRFALQSHLRYIFHPHRPAPCSANTSRESNNESAGLSSPAWYGLRVLRVAKLRKIRQLHRTKL